MKLQTLSQLEQSVGGRPKVVESKVRMSFYLTQTESAQLRALSNDEARPLSQQVRQIIREYLSAHPSTD